MKNTLGDRFKNNMFVKPLYRKLRNTNKIKPNKVIIHRRLNLDGHGISVNRKVMNDTNGVSLKRKCINRVSTGRTEDKNRLFRTKVCNGFSAPGNMLSAVENRKPKSEVKGIEDRSSKLVQADNEFVVVHKAANAWLRLYPLPKLPEESVASVIFRCALCQLGLCSMLVLWTVIWVFVIHSFEGPYEMEVSIDFEKEQNFIVIKLATELRQITPLAPTWRSAIERRIQEVRHLTMDAVNRGAHLQTGEFWDLSGTFLFTIYVMTALGFGAPVPQTTWGRSAALIYAIFAVPTHLYLMLNASLCLVVNVETYLKKLRLKTRGGRLSCVERTTSQIGTESPNCSRNSEVLKTPNISTFRLKIMRFFGVFVACRSVPLMAILYYIFGATVFGVARGKTSLDIALFPLEFTTSGGLEHISGHVRILYGWYVEGAMLLLSCGLAALRCHSGAALTCMTEKYRLFESQ